jgi:hypothetical protein
MSLAKIADIAYALIREEVTEQIRTLRLGWASRGDPKHPMPSLEEAYADLDKALEKDSRSGLTQEELELRTVLGLLK